MNEDQGQAIRLTLMILFTFPEGICFVFFLGMSLLWISASCTKRHVILLTLAR